jgi:apolipoprotein N-acyltransferase
LPSSSLDTNPEPLSPRAAWVAAAASIPLAFLSYPGVGWWPLGFVAFAPLVVAIRRQSPGRALVIGWLSGTVMVALGFHWLLGTLRSFTRLSVLGCVAALVLVSVIQASRFAMFAWLTARGARRGWPLAPVALLAFAASETLGPALFPWNYAAVVHNVPSLMQPAEVGGPITVTLVLLAANVAVAEAVARRWRSAAVLASGVLVAWLWGAWRMTVVDLRVAEATPVKIGLVQANVSIEAKRANPQQSVAEHLRLTRELVRGTTPRPELVVWSETNLAEAIAERDIPSEVFRQVGERVQAPVIVGAVVSSGGRRFNSALLVGQGGTVTGRYDKQQLLPFAEYPGIERSFGWQARLFPYTGRFSPGPEAGTLKLGDHEIAVSICYEDVLPTVVRRGVAAGHPDLLINISNDAWFGATPESEIHLALAKFRAVEHRRFLVRSGNTGVSAFIDPTGRVLARSRPFQQETMMHEVRWLRGRTVFEALGSAPWWLATALSLLAAFVPARRRLANPSTRTPSQIG